MSTKPTTIDMFPLFGDFAEDKDQAANLRETSIKLCVAQRRIVVFDFKGVTLVTQSFIHALISNVLRVNGEDALNYLEFVNCTPGVKGIISTVVQYSLDSIPDVDEDGKEKEA